MILYSTNNKEEKTGFQSAVIQGLAPDGGLYMPESLPALSLDFWKSLKNRNIQEVADSVYAELLADVFSTKQRQELVEKAFTFDAPLVSLDDIHVLELFHGPTLAFKDFGARSMAAMLSVFAKEKGEKITIVTATSGDTGAAVAHGFYKTPGVEVFIFYPGNQVTPLQEKQFATLGENITALEVDGTFDDCQKLVKSCFSDSDILNKKKLTTANSINIARLIPQMVYYIKAVAAFIPEKGAMPDLLCAVPSGNFGNLTAGLMAKKMGLPVKRFVAATNVNHVVPDYLEKGNFTPISSLRTISNAMDVGNPSNFDRMMDLYGHDHDAMADDIMGAWFNDDETEKTIVDVFKTFGYVMDPHTSVGYLGCQRYQEWFDESITLSTAHPSKFPETIDKLLPGVLEIPERLQQLASKEKKSVKIEASMEAAKSVLLDS